MLKAVDLMDPVTRQLECSKGPWAPWDSAFRPDFRWVLDPESLALVLGDSTTGRWVYEVDLERCTTSALVLDQIAQVAGKGWASDKVLARLVRALNDVLKLQANLCGSGRERGPIDVKALLARTRTP